MRLRISRAPSNEAAEAAAIPPFARAAIGLALLAILVRLLYCGAVYPHVGQRMGWTGIDDGYDDIARTLLDGNGYAFSATAHPNVTAPPGYAFTLAGLFAITGNRAAEGWHLWVFHALADGLSTFLLALYGRRLLGSARAALLAAALWALYPQIIVYAARPFSEIPFTLLLLLLAFATARFFRTGSSIDGVLTGLLWGLAVLFKEKLILLPLPIVAILAKRQHRRGRPFLAPAIAMVITMAAVIAPWMLRQHSVTGHWVPITERSGRALQFGLDTDFTRPDVQADDFVERGGHRPVSNREPHGVLAALRRITSSPLDYLRKVLVKSAVFWFWGQTRVVGMNAAVQIPLVLLGLARYLLWRRRVDLTVPALLIGYFVVIHALTTVRMRYSLPIMPFVILLAAAAIDGLLKRARPCSAAIAALVCLAIPAPSGGAMADSLAARAGGAISAGSLHERVLELSGERPVLIAGRPHTLLNTYSYSEECRQAELFVAERFAEAGFDVELQPYLGSSLFAVASAPSYLAAAGDGGTVLISEDGGAHWTLRANTPRFDLRALAARGDTLWAAGTEGIVVSVDRGVAWQTADTPAGASLRAITFGLGDTMWAAGAGGAVLRSVDRGFHWEARPQPFDRVLTGIARAPDGRLFASAWGAVLEGDAQGGSWRVSALPPIHRFMAVQFTATGTGWVVGWDGALYRSDDGGSQWRAVDPGIPDLDLEAISFDAAGNGIAVGWGGTILRSANRGDSWAASSVGSEAILRAVSAGAPGTIAGLRTLLVSNGAAFEPPAAVEGAWHNVVATLPGRQSRALCLLTAHLDNITAEPFGRAYGADDDASGVAALLEAAPALARFAFARTVRLVAFTGEEQGLFGSAEYAAAAEARGDSIAGVYQMDMIAYNSDEIPAMDLHAGPDSTSRALAASFVEMASRVSPSLLPVVETDRASVASDHASFWRHGYPAVLVAEDYIGTPGDPDDPGDFNPYLHSLGDRAGVLDPLYHAAIARAAVASVALAAGPIEEIEPAPPRHSLLVAAPAVPNPGRSFRIDYALSRAASVRLEVYDASGRRVSIERWDDRESGAQTATWTGRGREGRPVPSGVYFYRLVAAGEDAYGRMVVAR